MNSRGPAWLKPSQGLGPQRDRAGDVRVKSSLQLEPVLTDWQSRATVSVADGIMFAYA